MQKILVKQFIQRIFPQHSRGAGVELPGRGDCRHLQKAGNRGERNTEKNKRRGKSEEAGDGHARGRFQQDFGEEKEQTFQQASRNRDTEARPPPLAPPQPLTAQPPRPLFWAAEVSLVEKPGEPANLRERGALGRGYIGDVQCYRGNLMGGF